MLNCIVLLLVVQFEFEFSEFEFELNCLNQFQKKMQSLSFLSLSFSPLIPAQPNLFFFFPFSLAGQTSPAGPPSHSGPARPGLPLPQPPTSGPCLSGRPSPRARPGLLHSPAAPRLTGLPLARTPRRSAPPLYKRRTAPWEPFSYPRRRPFAPNPSPRRHWRRRARARRRPAAPPPIFDEFDAQELREV